MKHLDLKDLLEAADTSLTLVKATDETAAVVIHGCTKASKQWKTAIKKFGVDSKIEVTRDESALVDTNMSDEKKTALAYLVTSIEGLKGGTLNKFEDIKELFLDPQARIIPTKWNTHLDTLGNELLD